MSRLTTKSYSSIIDCLDCVEYEECYGNTCNAIDRVIDKLAEYENLDERCIKECGCGLNMVVQKYQEFLEHMHELAEYWKLEKEGLLFKLPCKVGDTVYYLKSRWKDKMGNTGVECYISEETAYSLSWIVEKLDKFGETVFSTKEEAEQKLKEIKEKIT